MNSANFCKQSPQPLRLRTPTPQSSNSLHTIHFYVTPQERATSIVCQLKSSSGVHVCVRMAEDVCEYHIAQHRRLTQSHLSLNFDILKVCGNFELTGLVWRKSRAPFFSEAV